MIECLEYWGKLLKTNNEESIMFLNPNIKNYVNKYDLAERCDAFGALGFNRNDVAALALGIYRQCRYF